MRYVVITGARGYIGSALVKRLVSEGQPLRLISRAGATTGEKLTAASDYIAADLREEAPWRGLMQETAAIVHLSSRTDLRAAEIDPDGDTDLNVQPVRALIRAAERSGVVPSVIFASAVTIVGIAHANPVNEQTPDQPCSVYDRHKLECETLLGEATSRGVVRACSLRLSNVFGYGDGVASVNANRGVLNAMMQRACRGEPLTIYGDGQYVRDFIFIGDVVEAFCRALLSPPVQKGGHYVIASGRGYRLAEAFELVAQEALRATGRRAEIRRVSEPLDLHPIERRNFVGDSHLFAAMTGWRPRFDLRSGIRDYFERSLAGVDVPASAAHGD